MLLRSSDHKLIYCNLNTDVDLVKERRLRFDTIGWI